MRWAFAALMTFHGLIHFMGPAKAFGLAELPQLTQPISRGVGVLWALAGVAMLGAAAHYLVAPRQWWITGLVAVALSQVVIVSAWGDARFGTLANLVVLAVAAYGFASNGPYSLRSQYERDVQEATERLAASTDGARPTMGEAGGELLTEEDLTGLPDPLRRYIVASGAVGRPRPRHFEARWTGRIRGGPDEAWMEFTAEQHNFVDPPARFFFMDARRAGLPLDVYHDLRDTRARMRVRLLSMVPLVHETGEEMDRAESVTLFNDLVLFLPGSLLDPRLEWEPVDDRSVRGRYTHGAHTVEAVIQFDEEDRLVDFVSDDRYATGSEGGDLVAMQWSTPAASWRTFDGVRVMAGGEGRWHPDGAPAWSYVELTLVDLSWR